MNDLVQSVAAPEVIAEWTVHAQLTISRNDTRKHNENITFDDGGNQPSTTAKSAVGNPVRVSYQWNSDDLDAANAHELRRPQLPIGRAVSSEPTCKSQCRSTCNVVLTACTDLYPTMRANPDGADDVRTYNTTATCKVVPKTIEENVFAQHTHNDGTTHKCPSFRDAYSQTSDNESKIANKVASRSRSQRAYDFGRITNESLADSQLPSSNHLSPNISFEDGTTISSSRTPLHIRRISPSTIRTISPNSTAIKLASEPSPARGRNASTAANKQPRTVHIDVYCTGSEMENDEDDVDVDSFSTDSISPSTSLSSLDAAAAAAKCNQRLDSERHDVRRDAQHHRKRAERSAAMDNGIDDASNSTPQTVFNAAQMRLHHSRRNSRQPLPRRLINQLLDQAAAAAEPQPGRLRQYILDQANEKDEISVSKLMLIDMHLGNGTHNVQPTQMAFGAAVAEANGTVRPFSLAHFANASVDVDQSSDYPNSSRSTMRDPTWSSVEASSPVVVEPIRSVADSVSAMDSEWLDTTTSGRRNVVDTPFGRSFEHNCMLNNCNSIVHHGNREQHAERPAAAASMDVNRFYVRQNAVDPETPDTTDGAAVQPPNVWQQRRRPSAYGRSTSRTTTMTRFGERIEMSRERHFGPAKNPDCRCDHCRLHAAERKRVSKQIRGRAFSMGAEMMSAVLQSPDFRASRPPK